MARPRANPASAWPDMNPTSALNTSPDKKGFLLTDDDAPPSLDSGFCPDGQPRNDGHLRRTAIHAKGVSRTPLCALCDSARSALKAVSIGFLAALLAGPALAGDSAVGTVTHLSGTFSVLHADGSAKVLAVKSEIIEGDLLTTEAETYARIKFIDGSEVVLRPATQFKVDKFSFSEADASRDNAVFSLLKGGLRAVSGLIGKRSRDNVSYGTTVATIGIRGTHLGALLCNNDCGSIPTTSGTPPPDGLHTDVASGAIVVTNSAGSQQFSAGQFGYVGGPNTPPTLVPPSQGIQVTMPPSIAANAAQGRSPGGAGRDTSCAL
jgi:hypothetical protein